MQPPFLVAYDFETMIVETDDQSKSEELRKNKSSTVKNGEHIPIGFVQAICYLEDIKKKMNIFVLLVKIDQMCLLKRSVKSCTNLQLFQDKK